MTAFETPKQMVSEPVTASETTRLLVSEPVTSVLMQGKPSVLATLTLLGDVALLVKSENTASKNTLLAALSPWIEPTLALLSYYIHDHGNVIIVFFSHYISLFQVNFRKFVINEVNN